MVKLSEIEITEENYDAGRPQKTFEVIDLGYLNFAPAGANGISLVYRFRGVHEIFRGVFSAWRSLRQSAYHSPVHPNNQVTPEEEFLFRKDTSRLSLHQYHFMNEQLIFQIRRFFESLLHLVQIELFRKQTNVRDEIPDRIEVDSLGQLLCEKKAQERSNLRELFFAEDQLAGANYQFLNLVNRLGNAMRHHPYFDDVYQKLGMDGPTLLGIEMNSRNTSIAIFHNHNSFHVMMGFQDTTLRILERFQKEFASSS